MSLNKTNQAIRILRKLAQQNPLPMEMHDEITRTLINLLKHKASLKK